MYRLSSSLPAVTNTTTTTASVSIGLTIAGISTADIYVSALTVGYTVAFTTQQAVKLFIDTTEVFRTLVLAPRRFDFYNPIRIQRGHNLVATASNSVNTISVMLSLEWYLQK